MAEQLLHWLTHAGTASYLVIFIFVFAESGLMLFLPGETALFLGGVLVSRGLLERWPLAAVAVVAAILGDLCGYLLGRGPGRRRFDFHGSFLLMRPKHVATARAFLDRFGGIAIVVARFVSLLRVAAPFVAGLTGLPPKRFIPFSALAGLLGGISFVLLGELAGASWEGSHRLLGRVGLALAGLGALAFLWMKWKRDRQAAQRQAG
jgi:membrane-associated protein